MSEFEVLETIRCKDCGIETAFVSVEGEVLVYERVEHSINCEVDSKCPFGVFFPSHGRDARCWDKPCEYYCSSDCNWKWELVLNKVII